MGRRRNEVVRGARQRRVEETEAAEGSAALRRYPREPLPVPPPLRPQPATASLNHMQPPASST